MLFQMPWSVPPQPSLSKVRVLQVAVTSPAPCRYAGCLKVFPRQTMNPVFRLLNRLLTVKSNSS